MNCTHSPPGALKEHPGLSRPALRMSSPGTGRLDPHYHSLPKEKKPQPPHSLPLFLFFDITVNLGLAVLGLQSSLSLYAEQ